MVIPCWNADAAVLTTVLARFDALRATVAAETGDELEIVVANASTDDPVEPPAAVSVASAADVFLRCPRPGRGEQMNLGARAATGDALLFQHVDTEFDARHLRALLGALRDDGPRLVGGAFRRRFRDADRHPHLRWLERLAGFTPGIFFGDQSIFVRREAFVSLGGYTNFPLMEDLDFARRLRRFVRGQRRAGVHLTLLEPAVVTSSRRYVENGPWRTTFLNALFIVLFTLGVSPHRLHRWYYARREKVQASKPSGSKQTQNGVRQKR